MELEKTMHISAAGMRAQSERLRIISENMANADSLSLSPDGEPYRRKMITFRNVLDTEVGARLIKPGSVAIDKSDFGSKFDPGHPGADAAGYVKTPNVNALVEIMDMRAAQRTYEANLKVIETARGMMMRTLDLLRN